MNQQRPSPKSFWRALLQLIRWMHTGIQGVWTILIVFIGVLLWVWVFGLPGPVRDRLMRRIGSDGFTLSAREIRIDLPSGFLIKGFSIDGPVPLGTSFLSATQAKIGVDWSSLRGQGEFFQSIDVRDGYLRWPEPGILSSNGSIAVSNLILNATAGSNTITIQIKESMSSLCAATGTVEILRAAAAAIRTGDAGFWGEIRDLAERSAQPRDLPDPFDAAVRDIRLSAPPDVHVSARYSLVTNRLMEMRADIKTADAAFRRLTFQGARWSIETDTSDIVRVSGVCTGLSGNLIVGARLQPLNRHLDLDVSSTLPYQRIIEWVPPSATARMRDIGIEGCETLALNLSAQRIAFTGGFKSVSCAVDASRVSVKGILFDRVHADAALDDDHLMFSNAIAIHTPASGTVSRISAEGARDADGSLRACVDFAADPKLFHLLGRAAPSNLIESFRFGPHWPVASLVIKRDAGPDEPYRVAGTLAAESFHYNEVEISRFTTGLSYSNRWLALAPWDLHRPEGRLTGSLLFDLDHDVEQVDMESTIDGEAVKKLIGKGFAESLSFAHFAGSEQITARGFVGKAGTGTSLQISIQSTNTVLDRARFDRLSLDLYVREQAYDFTRINGSAYGGSVTGVLKLVLCPTSPPQYDVTAWLAGADLRAVLTDLQPEETGSPDGRLSAQLHLQGSAGSGLSSTAAGSGRLEVTEGDLFRLRLFGALSEWVPVVGYARQHSFKSDVLVRDGRVELRDAMLEGDVISLRMTGAYYFDRRVKFIMEAKLLREGTAASAVRIITLPVTKLLRFSITGTAGAPVARPTTLSSDIFAEDLL